MTYKKRNYRNDCRLPPEYKINAPCRYDCEYDKLPDRDGYLFTYRYNTQASNRLYTCHVPLYGKLFKPITAVNTTNRVERELHLLNPVLRILKHPLSKLSFLSVFAVNICSVLFAWQPQNFIIAAVVKGMLLSQPVFIGISVAYGAALMISYVSSLKIKQLTAKLDNMIERLDSKNSRQILQELQDLKSRNALFFSYYYFENDLLRFKNYYLLGLAYGMGEQYEPLYKFVRALPYVPSDADALQCIRHIINGYYKFFLSCNEKDCQSYQMTIKTYLDQVPTDPKLHAAITRKLESGILECYCLLKDDRAKDAINKFRTLEFDAFTDELYPHLSIMYHQMDAALTLAGKPFVGHAGDISEHEERMTLARCSLLRVQSYIDTYYPEESAAHRAYVMEFEKFWASLPVIPYLEDPGYMAVWQNLHLRTIIEPIEPEVPNKHVKIEFEPKKLSM